MESAWNLATGDPELKIGVMDTGVNLQHPDLVGNVWTNPNDPPGGGDNDGNGYADDVHGWDFLEGDNDPTTITAPA
jgi:subtilisin family serine protease